MAFFSDILKKIKKPVDVLKNFLTPKERTSIQEKEKSSPLQRIEAKTPSFEYKPPSFEGLKNFASSLIPPKEAFERREPIPRETPEERAARLAKAHETTKKIAEFGKAVLRAGPRAAASVTLEAQGRRTMIPETKAEKFLFGEEPLESITERVERFPERAKEFGIQEPTAKKIAPFAVIGLTALDILPPLPGKSGLKAVAKKALTTKTAKEFAKAVTKKEANQILKAGFKSIDDFFEVAKNPAAKTNTKIVDELKAAVSIKPEGPTIPKELESFVPKAGKHKDVNSFIREISGDTYAPEFRNPIADFWRKKYVQPLSKGSKATFTTDVVAFERNLDDALNTKYAKDQLANMSVRQKSEIVNGKKWADLYGDMLENNLFKFQQDFFKAAKTATPAQVKPTDALKEAVSKTVHSKKLESGIDEAYRALEKTGKDDVYNLGKVGDYIADPKVREQYKDVLDTPLYIKKQMPMGKAHGSLSVDPKGNPAIVLSDGLTKDMIDRTLVEELTHARQFKKGIRPTKGVPYKEIPEEIRAKKAAKHFAPKTTLEDLIEEAGLHRTKAKQFSNNDLEKEFVARQLGVAEGIEKAVDELKRVAPAAKARPTEALKTALKPKHADPFELAKKPDYAKELRTAIGDKETILAHQEQFYVRPKRMKEGVFYHFTPDKKLTAEGLLSGTAKRFDKQLGPGLYVGQDAQALKNFYGLDMRGGQAVRLEGNPKILDLTDSFKSVDDANRAARKEFPKEKYPLGKWVQKQGYDGIKYFDPVATGEEYVVYNAKAFGGKPSEALKAAAKTDIPKIKGAKAIDLSQPAKAAQPSKVQEIIGEYQKRINTTPAKKAATPITKTLDETYTAIIDRFHPITKLARKAADLRPGENPELLARRYLGIQGISEAKLFWNTTRLTAEGNLEVTGPGLSKILKPAKNNIDDLRTLMIAERDIELSTRTLESGKKVVGTTPKQSKEVINALKQKYGGKGFEQLSKTALGVRDWSRKALLDPLLEVGAISKEQYDTIAKSNKFYVPFQRVIEELETHGFVPKKANIFSPRSVPVKKLKGSTKDIIDPFESMITNAYKVTDFVERARVGRSITNLRNTSPELAEMIKPIKPKLVPVAKQGEELIFRPSFFTPDKNTIMVFENGKRKFYQVPEDVFKAISGMMESDVGAIMKVLAFPARTLRAGATLTPEFMGRNPLRDQLTAFVFSKYGYVPGVDLAKGIFNTIGKTDLHGRWLAGGGAQSMLVSLDRVTSQATLAKVLGSKDIKGMVKNPLEALRMLSEFGEKGTRVGAFGRAVKKGVNDLEAAFESRDITLDFARRGSQTRAVNMLVAFWNAQVQGLNKMVRAFRERPMQTTFKAASGITLPSVLLYLNNRNDPRYQELPQWQKDLFWILPVGDDGPIIRIPKPFEVGIIFGTVPEHILTWIDKNDPEALTSAEKTLMEASAPGYIPTGLQPIIENIANYSFFRQRPIVSEGKQALPKELQADRYTSETAKEVGQLIKQSPAKIENLFVSYTGGLGKYALDASDKLLKTLGVISPPPEPAKTLADRPFIRAFVAREPIGSGSESVNKFYNLYDEANSTKAAVKRLAEEGKEDAAVNYLRSHPAGFYTSGLNKIARTFSDLRKKRDAVLDSRDLNPEQKKRAIDALDKIMTEIASQTVELVGSSNEKFRQ